MESIVKKVFERLKHTYKFGRNLTLKVKFADFNQITRSKTFDTPLVSYEMLWQNSCELINEAYNSNHNVRLLGVSVSNLLTEEQVAIQLEINWNEYLST